MNGVSIATKRLQRLTDDLQTIWDWRDDLTARLRRAHLCFEFVGLDPDEQDELEAETEAFMQVCRALADSFARAETERRAA